MYTLSGAATVTLPLVWLAGTVMVVLPSLRVKVRAPWLLIGKPVGPVKVTV
ncbi:hypothetical protein D3C76_1224850 [compost metagenome]